MTVTTKSVPKAISFSALIRSVSCAGPFMSGKEKGQGGNDGTCWTTNSLLSNPLPALITFVCCIMPGRKNRGLEFALRCGYEQPKGLGWGNK